MTKTKLKDAIRKYNTIFVLSLALAIIIIDGTVLNVSISKLIVDLDTNLSSIQWVISAYSLVMAAFMITGGRLGDFLGRKRMFMLGAIIFAIGSFISSISTNVGMLLIGWSVIEGIGAALMMPATTSLLVTTYKGKERAIAYAVFGSIAGASSALGPIVGGYLTTNASWHWAFRINIFIVAILLLGATLLKESEDRKEKQQLDIPGVILSSLAMFFIVFGIVKTSTYGWIKAKQDFVISGHALNPAGISISLISVIVGLVVLGSFLFWQSYTEKHGRTPLVSLKLLKNKQFSTGVMTTMIMALGQAGLALTIPVFLQSIRGLDAFHTGIALLPMSFAILLTTPISTKLAQKVAPKKVVIIGLLINALALVVMHQSITKDATSWSLAPGLALYGIGMGFVMSQINNITLSAVENYQAGEAGGVNNTLRQIGSSLGSAIIGAVFLSAFTASLTTSIKQSTFIPEPAKPAIVEKINETNDSLEFSTGNSLNTGAGQQSEQTAKEFKTMITEATIDGNRKALLVSVALIGLAVLFAAILDDSKLENAIEKEENAKEENAKIVAH